MKAIIIATGESKRFLPYTESSSVSFMDINGLSLIEHQIKTLNEAGINDIVIVAGRHYKQFEDLKGNNIQTFYNPFYAIGNLVSSMWAVKQLLSETFILMYNDIYFESDSLNILLNNNQENNLVLLVSKGESDFEAEKVFIQNGLIVEISKNISGDKTSAAFIGLAYFKNWNLISLMEIINELLKDNLSSRFPDLVNSIINLGHKVTPKYLENTRWSDLDTPQDLEELRLKLTDQRGSDLVFVTMCADPLHYGHINLIEQAKILGKRLVVGLLTDEAIMEYKDSPLLSYEHRKLVIESIKDIDQVVPQTSGLDYSENLKLLKPSFLVHGDDWISGPLSKTRLDAIQTMKGWGGVVVDAKYTKGVCSTNIKKSLKS